MRDELDRWSAFVKSAQMKDYTAKGGLTGALAGGALAAALSAMYYGKKNKKDEKKQSMPGKVLKSLLWTALGAAGGGLAGAGIGRMIATHIKYRRALDEAKETVKERRRMYGIPEKGRKDGRVIYVNYPKNKFELKGIYSKLFGKSVPIQHASLLVMNEDGSDAALYSPRMNADQEDVKRVGKSLIEDGKAENNVKLVEEGKNLLSEKIDRGTYDIHMFNNRLKGKSDEEIARILADYGHANDLGGEVRMYEGKKGIDRDLVEEFMEKAQRIAHIDGNPGYSIFPGGYNCGTASREGFDVAQDPKSHWRDMLFGGWPSNNAPSLAKETAAKYYKDEGREESMRNYGWARPGRE